MIEVILPSLSEIDAFMVTVWLTSPLIGDETRIAGGLFARASDCPNVTVLRTENIMIIIVNEAVGAVNIPLDLSITFFVSSIIKLIVTIKRLTATTVTCSKCGAQF
jgi:hypothetical protein